MQVLSIPNLFNLQVVVAYPYPTHEWNIVIGTHIITGRVGYACRVKNHRPKLDLVYGSSNLSNNVEEREECRYKAFYLAVSAEISPSPPPLAHSKFLSFGSFCFGPFQLKPAKIDRFRLVQAKIG